MIEVKVCQCSPRIRIDETNEDGSVKDTCQTRSDFPCELGVLEQSCEMWKHVRPMRASRNFVTGRNNESLMKQQTEIEAAGATPEDQKRKLLDAATPEPATLKMCVSML